jgi:hypothetical protein
MDDKGSFTVSCASVGHGKLDLSISQQARVTADRPALQLIIIVPNSYQSVPNRGLILSFHTSSFPTPINPCGPWLFKSPQSFIIIVDLIALFPPLFTTPTINQPYNRNHAFRNGQ